MPGFLRTANRPAGLPVSLLLLALAVACNPRAAAPPADGYVRDRCAAAVPGSIVIYGDVEQRLEISVSELRNLERSRFDGQFHDGRPARFEGVPVSTLLTMAGVPAQLRSGDLVRLVVIEAADGYRAVFSLAEFNTGYRERVPILADRQDGEPIRENFGPVQLIVPGDLRQGRWVRQVECIRVERWAP
jgi:DMSO/TMAO reductase YedYZ molybdopterin-dependent catalytic subunit